MQTSFADDSITIQKCRTDIADEGVEGRLSERWQGAIADCGSCARHRACRCGHAGSKRFEVCEYINTMLC